MILSLASSALGGTVAEEVGLNALIKRLGAGNYPTGAGVIVAQVEAPISGAYGPDVNHPEFAGKSFVEHSGPAGNSFHATGVGTHYYGTTTSIAPGMTTIHIWEVVSWLFGGFLNTSGGSSVPPLVNPPGLKIYNHSWIGNLAAQNDSLRRTDFAIVRDQTLMVSGMPNGQGTGTVLLHHNYNGIAVGMANGTHGTGPTLSAVDGPNRPKPEIVAPLASSSDATATISAAAALMVETIADTPALATNPNASRSETLKAVLMAGATHRTGWSNNAIQTGPQRGVTFTPLDLTYGVDVVNVNSSHMILTGLEHNGSSSPPGSVSAPFAGWDLASLGHQGNSYYSFNVSSVADEVAVIATWHRIVTSSFASFSLANFDLELFRVDENGGLASLLGDAGLPYFAGGNVRSQSGVANVEHLYITGLQPGEYVLHVKRADSLGGMRDVAIAWLFPEPEPIPGDVNGDGSVNVDDLLAVINAWGSCPGCPADVNGDNVVNVDDLLMVINNWG